MSAKFVTILSLAGLCCCQKAACTKVAPILISSQNSWFGVHEGKIQICPEGREGVEAKALVNSEMWAQNLDQAAVRINLDGSDLGSCEALPCEVDLPLLWQGVHKVTLFNHTAKNNKDIGYCSAGFTMSEIIIVVEGFSERVGQDWGASRHSNSNWREALAEDLFPEIRMEEEWEYKERHRIDPQEMGTGSACAGQSACGVWVDPSNPSICTDLCVHTSFLPSGNLFSLKSERLASASAALRRLLYDRQFPAEPPSMLSIRSPQSPISGFGVTMVYAVHNLAKIFAAGALFLPARDSMALWTSERYCGVERHLGCYFEAVSNVSVQLVDSAGRTLSLPAEREQDITGVDGIVHDFGFEGYLDLGSFWLQAIALDFIWKPNSRARTYIQELRTKRTLHHPAIAMHVRRGDSHLAGRWMPTLATYLEAAHTLRTKYGVSTIFLATDDTETATQCQHLQDWNCSSLPVTLPSVSFRMKRHKVRYLLASSEIFDPKAPEHNPQESAYDKWVETRIQHGEVDASEAAMHAIAEIDTLGDCDFFVGRLDSAISRLALMLIFARHGPRPYISLDKPWAQPPYGIIN